MAEQGLRQIDLAERMNVSQGTVSGWLNSAVPQRRTAIALAAVLGVNLQWLLTGQGKKSSVGKTTQADVGTPKSSVALVLISEADHDRGYVELPLHYRRGSVPKGFPAKLRVHRLSSREGPQLLRAAMDSKDPYLVMLAALPIEWRADSFLDKLTPPTIIALTKAAFILAYGEKPAGKFLSDLNFNF